MRLQHPVCFIFPGSPAAPPLRGAWPPQAPPSAEPPDAQPAAANGPKAPPEQPFGSRKQCKATANYAFNVHSFEIAVV